MGTDWLQNAQVVLLKGSSCVGTAPSLPLPPPVPQSGAAHLVTAVTRPPEAAGALGQSSP